MKKLKDKIYSIFETLITLTMLIAFLAVFVLIIFGVAYLIWWMCLSLF